MRGMLEELAKTRDAMGDVCSELGMRKYKVMSPVDLLGTRVSMEENDLIGILGEDQVHMNVGGYGKLAACLMDMVERPGAIFGGDRRGKEEDEVEEEAEVIGGWHRKKHKWIHNHVLCIAHVCFLDF
jgi:hypothetical protein